MDWARILAFVTGIVDQPRGEDQRGPPCRAGLGELQPPLQLGFMPNCVICIMDRRIERGNDRKKNAPARAGA